MIIEKKKISDLKPNPDNPRQSTQEQEENLKQSLLKFGVVEPIIVNNETGNIIGGHFRVRELKKLGVEEVDCVMVDLSVEDEKELNIRLNANTGEWNWEIINDKWETNLLNSWGLDVPDESLLGKNREIDVDVFADEMVINLKYTADEYWKVKDQLNKIADTPEQAVWKLLSNE